MKKKIILLQVLLAANFGFAQTDVKKDAATDVAVEKVETVNTDAPTKTYSNDFNKWTLEASIGNNKPIERFNPGYGGSNETTYLAFPKPSSYTLGLRYMVNPKFGVKVDFAYDKISDYESSNSLPFEMKQVRMGVQGVMNLANILDFNSFTSKLGLLLHSGIQISQLTPKLGVNEGRTEINGGYMIGITPQYKISKRLTVNADLSMFYNLRQHYTWDGMTNSSNQYNQDKSLNGKIFISTVGLAYSFGQNDEHADWIVPATNQAQADLEDALARIEKLENDLKDTDNDGVLDIVDVEPDTAADVWVDTKGRTTEKPKDGKDGKDGVDGGTGEKGVDGKTTIIEKANGIRKGSLLNIYYEINKTMPKVESMNDVRAIIVFMKENTDSKIKLIGYADPRGGAVTNLKLSHDRAKVLSKLLVAEGINENRIKFLGLGTPKKMIKSKEDMDFARRTEVIVE